MWTATINQLGSSPLESVTQNQYKRRDSFENEDVDVIESDGEIS